MILVSVVSPFFLPFLLTTGLKDVHSRQKLTTDFFKLFELTILVVNISISRKKNMLTMVSRGSFFNKITKKQNHRICPYLIVLTTDFFLI